MGEVVGQAQKSKANQNSWTQNIVQWLRTKILNRRPPPQDLPLSEATQDQRKKVLGKVLLHAAALMEAIDMSVEKKLMLEYLNKKPPLHPRRTLDQSYYGALKDTGMRDRDQVVYRATTPAGHNCLDYIEEEDSSRNCSKGVDEGETRKKPPKPQKCKQCQEDIRKVPRLIMVDQLWLWILDENMYCPIIPARIMASGF